MIRGEDVFINGDGETSRDFSHVANAMQANILAALAPAQCAGIYNMAVGGRTTLNTVFGFLREALALYGINYERPPIYRDFRPGDVRHSQADIGKAHGQLGYVPSFTIAEGIQAAVPWYVSRLHSA